jgi:hypothetical protein
MKRIAAVIASGLPASVIVALTLLAAPLAATAADKAHDCDRACLRSILDRYLTAVLKHDPAAAPLAVGYRHTENAINVPLGKGIWQTATALGKVQRRYIDPVSSQAAYYGILDESGRLAVVTARLRVEDRAITEAEWYIARDGDPGLPGAKPPNLWNPASLTANPPPERSVPAGKRLPRRAMIAIVNSYYDGITSHDRNVVLARTGCNRYENGTRVTGHRGGVDDDCIGGLTHFNLSNVAARRVSFVDDQAGMVLGMAVFIRRPGSPVPRNAFSEWFSIDDGKIQDIWTAMYYPGPERAVPNWPPFEGNFPLAPGVIPTVPVNPATPRPSGP